MYINVVGYINSKNPTYQKHAKVLLTCHFAGVSLPKETADYFGHPDAELYLLDKKLETELPIQNWKNGDSVGYELIVKDIPEDVCRIRINLDY